MSYDHAPYQGFGDPDSSAAFIPFHVEVDEDGTYGDWQQEMMESTRQYAGSSSYVTQISGFGPARLTLPIWFDSRSDFRRFQTRYGTTGTLSLLAHLTNHAGVVRSWGDGREYEQFANTLVYEITDIRSNIDETVTCRVTFQRAYNPRAAS